MAVPYSISLAFITSDETWKIALQAVQDIRHGHTLDSGKNAAVLALAASIHYAQPDCSMSEFYKALGGWVEQGGEVIRRFVDLCWPTWTEHHKESVDPAMAFPEQMSHLNLMFTSTESTREFLATRHILAHLMEAAEQQFAVEPGIGSNPRWLVGTLMFGIILSFLLSMSP